MTDRATIITCPHGVRVEEVDPPQTHSIYRRAWLRDALLACPACRAEATKYLEEPGT